MNAREERLDFLKHSLASLHASFAAFSKECDRIRNECPENMDQVQILAALHDHLMTSAFKMLIELVSENADLSAAVSRELYHIELQKMLGLMGIKLTDKAV